MISRVSYQSVFFCSGVLLWIRIKRLEKPQLALTHEDWEMQCPRSYSDGLVTSESHLLVAAALPLRGFSQSRTASAGSARGG